MRQATKVLFIILGLSVLIYTGFTSWIMYQFFYLDTGWTNAYDVSSHLFYAGLYAFCVFAVLTGLVGLGLFFRAVFAKKRHRHLKVPVEEGSVDISEEAMVSSVKSVLADYREIKNHDIRLDIDNKRGTIRAHIDCNVNEGVNLNELGTTIGERVGRDLKNMTGMHVKDVNVGFSEINEPTAEVGDGQ